LKGKRKNSRFKYVKKISAEPMSQEDYETAMKLLAKLVARVYAADHPEKFGPFLKKTLDEDPENGPNSSDKN